MKTTARCYQEHIIHLALAPQPCNDSLRWASLPPAVNGGTGWYHWNGLSLPLSFSRQPGAVALGGAFQMHINLAFLVDPYGACRLLGLLSALLTHEAQLELCSSHKSLTVLASQFCKSMCVFPPCQDVRFPTNVCELPLKPQNPPSNLLAISCKNGTLSIIFKSQTPILPAIIL